MWRFFLGLEPPELPEAPPPIAIKLLSPGDRMSQATEKIAGVHCWAAPPVWLMDPRRGWVYVYSGGLARIESVKVPELVELQPADVFGA